MEDWIAEQIRGNLAGAATDKLHDFQPITLCERGLRPLWTRNDAAVVLDSNAVELEAESLQESGQT